MGLDLKLREGDWPGCDGKAEPKFAEGFDEVGQFFGGGRFQDHGVCAHEPSRVEIFEREDAGEDHDGNGMHVVVLAMGRY